MRTKKKRLYLVVGLFQDGLAPTYEVGRSFQTKKSAEHYAQILLSGVPGGIEDDGYVHEPAISVSIQRSDVVMFSEMPEQFPESRKVTW